MTIITTSGGMITFQDSVTGFTRQIGTNQLWLQFKADTVNFLQVAIPTDGSDGTPFWSSRASNMTINGETYTIEQLKNGEGLSDLFSAMGFNIEIVDELPDSGDPSTIYLVYDDETGSYTEYLWLAQEQVYEELGSVADVNLSNYYTKSETDTLLSGKASTSSLATVATTGAYSDLSGTPTIPAAQIQSDWNQSDNTSLDYIKNKPSIPAAQVNSNWNEADQSSKAYILNKPTIPQVDANLTENSTNAAQSGATFTALAGKQATLVSGTNIKTINNQSLLGSGNITIEGGGGGTQVQSDWNESDQSSMAYILNKPTIPTVPTNVSAFTNDAGYLTSHQSLADVFGIVDYDSSTKHINFYGKDDTSKTTVLGYVDATDFVVDGMVSNVEVKSVTISGTPTTCLVITFNSDAGKQDINIPISQIFDASNYYTKSEVDTALSGKANTSSLATVATTGAYSDLSGTPTIPAAQVNSDWNASSGVAQILNKPTLATVATSGSYSDLSGTPTIDNALSDQSTNAVQNAVVTGAIQQAISQTTKGFDEQARYFSVPLQQGQNLVAGTNITLTPTATTMTGQLWDEQTQQWVNTTYNVTGLEISATGGGGSGTVTGVKMNNGSAIQPDANGVVDLGTVITAHQTVDTVLSQSSNNPIANSTVYAAIGDIEAALQAINGTSNS